MDLARWPTEERWLFAIDLYNHGYFWESHEYWEALWHGQRRRGHVATFLKALIQTSAAHIKSIEGNLVGVDILASKSDGMLADLHDAGMDQLLGVHLGGFRVSRNLWFGRILAGQVPPMGSFPFVHLMEPNK